MIFSTDFPTCCLAAGPSTSLRLTVPEVEKNPNSTNVHGAIAYDFRRIFAFFETKTGMLHIFIGGHKGDPNVQGEFNERLKIDAEEAQALWRKIEKIEDPENQLAIVASGDARFTDSGVEIIPAFIMGDLARQHPDFAHLLETQLENAVFAKITVILEDAFTNITPVRFVNYAFDGLVPPPRLEEIPVELHDVGIVYALGRK